MFKIKLQYPIKSATGQTITEITLRRAARGDLKASQKYSTDLGEQEDFLFARLSGLTMEDIELMDLADSETVTTNFREMVAGKRNANAGRNPAGSVENTTV